MLTVTYSENIPNIMKNCLNLPIEISLLVTLIMFRQSITYARCVTNVLVKQFCFNVIFGFILFYFVFFNCYRKVYPDKTGHSFLIFSKLNLHLQFFFH